MKKLLPALAVLAFTAGLLARPEAVSAAVREGLTLCYQTVIPSLFPFFAAVGLLTRLGLALLAALGAFPGSWLGAVLLQSIPEQTVRVMMIAAIPLVAAVVLRRKKDMVGKVLAPGRWRLPAAFGIGLLVGFYDGLVGASMTLKKVVGFIRWMMLVVLALLLAKMVADVVI